MAKKSAEDIKDEEKKEESKKAMPEDKDDKKEEKVVSKAPTETDDDDEDLSEMSDDEKKSYKALKQKVKKKLVKATEMNPQQSAESSETAEHTISPGEGKSGQNMQEGESSIDGKREQDTPMGKSAEMNLAKSPLYMKLTQNFESIEKSFKERMDALEKSQKARFETLSKGMADMKAAEEKLSKFYSQPLYKSAVDSQGPEAIKTEGSVKEQIEKGKVRFTQ